MGYLFGFALAFSLALTVARLCHLIAYSWWLIWAPVWGMVIVNLLFHLVCWYIAHRQLKQEAKNPPPKSKWQQKVEEMQAMQKSKK